MVDVQVGHPQIDPGVVAKYFSERRALLLGEVEDNVVIVVSGSNTSQAMIGAGVNARSIYLHNSRTGEEMTLVFVPRSQAEEALDISTWEILRLNNISLLTSQRP